MANYTFLQKNLFESNDLRNKFLRIIKQFKKVSSTCDVLNVPESSYYAYIKKAKNKGEQFNKNREFLKEINKNKLKLN